jgi:hypothetical protein
LQARATPLHDRADRGEEQADDERPHARFFPNE